VAQSPARRESHLAASVDRRANASPAPCICLAAVSRAENHGRHRRRSRARAGRRPARHPQGTAPRTLSRSSRTYPRAAHLSWRWTRGCRRRPEARLEGVARRKNAIAATPVKTPSGTRVTRATRRGAARGVREGASVTFIYTSARPAEAQMGVELRRTARVREAPNACAAARASARDCRARRHSLCSISRARAVGCRSPWAPGRDRHQRGRLDGAALRRKLDEVAYGMQATPSTWRLVLEAGTSRLAAPHRPRRGEELRRDLEDRLAEARGCGVEPYGPTGTPSGRACTRVHKGAGRGLIGRRPSPHLALRAREPRGCAQPIGVPGDALTSAASPYGWARDGTSARPEITEASRFLLQAAWGARRILSTGASLPVERDRRARVESARVDHAE